MEPTEMKTSNSATANENHGGSSGRRIRPSEHALRIALRTAKAEGMVVDKLCVTGGYIEIHFGGVEVESSDGNHGDLDKW
jgi:hypothetical protein